MGAQGPIGLVLEEVGLRQAWCYSCTKYSVAAFFALCPVFTSTVARQQAKWLVAVDLVRDESAQEFWACGRCRLW